MADDRRVIAWFSCGAASAVAARYAVSIYGDRCNVVYCDTAINEHPDNERFLADVEWWIGRKVTRIRSQSFATVEEVFEKRKYMSGISGAPCTVELKKVPRFDFQHADDIHIFGYLMEEHKRIANFKAANPELTLEWPLRDYKINKARCFKILEGAGIARPLAYDLGYKNNNCIGCVKATSPGYWNLVRETFPEVFERRAEQSRRLGVRLARYKGQRVFLASGR